MTGQQFSAILESAHQGEMEVLSEGASSKIGTSYVSGEGNRAHTVSIHKLVVRDSPRLAGEDIAHVQRLTEVLDQLPPIVVHRGTMRVIDGAHRLRAAHLVGRDTVEVSFFDGSEDSAFVQAVRANVRHGLPLSLAERRAAAERIMTSHPDWSDRRVAAVAGLSAKTVADIRPMSDSVDRQDEARWGRDGRRRPTDAASGRRHASRLIAERPEASLREVARAAGISPETVRDVRNRLARGEDPVPENRRRSGARPRREVGGGARGQAEGICGRIENRLLSHAQRADLVQALRRDPSLRLSESGRLLLRWLEVSQAATQDWERIVRAVPSHRVREIAELAKSCAEEWGRLAEQMSSQPAARVKA